MPLPFAELQIWDDDNQPVAPGEIGAIVARADGQMQGFWNNPEATAERIVDGWVKTGDIGRLDANGYLCTPDRADDMVISGGFNIYPAELENIIADHPGVLEVAAFGIPDSRWGETPCAVVCMQPDSRITQRDIIELCTARLGNCKRPGKVVLRQDPLPKTPVARSSARNCASLSGQATHGASQEPDSTRDGASTPTDHRSIHSPPTTSDMKPLCNARSGCSQGTNKGGGRCEATSQRNSKSPSRRSARRRGPIASKIRSDICCAVRISVRAPFSNRRSAIRTSRQPSTPAW
jgi:hypothetical protein